MLNKEERKMLNEIIETDELWERLIQEEYFTDAELRLITNISGYSVDTLNDCIYARYGYKNYKQLIEEY